MRVSEMEGSSNVTGHICQALKYGVENLLIWSEKGCLVNETILLAPVQDISWLPHATTGKVLA